MKLWEAKNWLGRYTTPNQNSAPAGTFTSANNLNLDRRGALVPRRGRDGTDNGPTSSYHHWKWWEYNGTAYLHWDDNGGTYGVASLSAGVWSTLSNTTTLAHFGTDYRVSPAKCNGNQYLATSIGVYRQESTSFVSAGGVKAIDIDRGSCTTADSASGILAPQTQGAWRAAFYYDDAEGNRHHGSPTGRCVLVNANASGGSNKAPVIRVLIPKMPNTASTALTVSYWVQLYRSSMTTYDSTTPTLSVEPPQDEALVYEERLTSGNISAGYVDIADVTPDALRGEHGYWTPYRDTLAFVREPPPLAKEIATWKGCLLYGNIKSRRRFGLTILGVGSPAIVDGDTITISDGTTPFTLTARTAPAGASEYGIVTSSAFSASQQIILTAQNLVAAINRNTTNTWCYAYYVGNPEDPRALGKLIIEARTFTTSLIYVYVGSGDANTCFEPSLPQNTTSSLVSGGQDEWEDGWAISIPGLPEAVPPDAFSRIGSGAIQRIMPLEDSVAFITDSGAYRLTGEPPAPGFPGTLRMEPIALNIVPVGRETFVRVGDAVFGLTNQGVLRITEGGFGFVSKDIDKTLLDTIATATLTATKQLAFAVAYETDRQYRLYLPTASNSTNCTGVHVLHVDSGGWTNEDYGGSCGIVLSSDDKLYLGTRRSTAGTAPYVFEEKTRTATDFLDDDARAIGCTLTLPPIVGSSLHVEKHFSEVQLDFEGTVPALVSCTFTTEHTSVGVNSTTHSSTQGRVRFEVPTSVARATKLTLSFGMDVEQVAVAITGASVKFREYGRPGK